MKSGWIDCVRWCHRADAPESVDALIEALTDLCDRSRCAPSVHATSMRSGFLRAEGYIVHYPGALVSLGNISLEADDDDERGRQLLIEVAKELFDAAFQQGAELVQAISPLIASRHSIESGTGFVSPDPLRDEVLQASGMLPIAKLVQMEAFGLQSTLRPTIPQSALECGQLDFVPHYHVPANRWSQLIESTYVETRDVPELNGHRKIESTLEGYASNTTGVPDTWWVIQCKGVDIGCLLLTRTANRCCELTYLGLAPQWRGKGLSKVIMNYVLDWALENRMDGITLAVDLRNTPAIGLYQSCSFTTYGFVQAWIRFPNG